MSVRNLFQPIRNPGFFKLFLVTIPLLAGILFIFMNPSKLDASDFVLIAWNPGQELLKTGSIYAGYPYPLWTVVVMLPFSVWPPQTAMVLWFTCNLLMLAASLALFISLFDWEISPALFVLLVSLSGFFLPVLTSTWLGQLSIFSLFMLSLTTHLFLHQRWTWLGIVLGLSFIKPQVMILLAGLLLLWALRQRRWQTLLGFSAVIIFLTLISLPFISFPGQIIGGGIGSHLATYIQKTSTLWGLSLSLGIPWLVPISISLASMIWLGWIWLPILRGTEMSSNQVLFLFSVATMVNLILVPYSWMHNLTLLLLPLGYSLALALKVKSRARFAWLALLFVIMHPLMLGLFIALNGLEHTQAYQIIPALALLPTMYYLESQTAHQISLMSNLPYQDKPSIWSSHSRIAARLGSLPVRSTVLDVGTASGMLARRSGNTSLRFFGIESNAEWAAIASPFYEKLWTCSFDEAPDNALRGYDAVVLADVLEHIPAPKIALNKLAGLQDPGSLFIISVPNVANLWIRLHLLMGHFDYAERGILDRTHLHFFTCKTLIDLVKGAGLDIISIKATPVPLELVSPFFATPLGRLLHAAFAWFTSLLPTLLGYQFIVEAKKHEHAELE